MSAFGKWVRAGAGDRRITWDRLYECTSADDAAVVGATLDALGPTALAAAAFDDVFGEAFAGLSKRLFDGPR